MQSVNTQDDLSPPVLKPKPKRGRKSKLELEQSLNKLNNVTPPPSELIKTVGDCAATETAPEINHSCFELDQVPQTKKRGRKPKCGKIVQNSAITNVTKFENVNVVLHLNCALKDLKTEDQTEEIKPFDDDTNNIHMSKFISPNISEQFSEPAENFELSGLFALTNNNVAASDGIADNTTATAPRNHSPLVNSDDVRQKLDELSFCLQNNICNKKSACFWCTCDFDNNVIHIPKSNNGETYQAYGCFCSPECATAFLFNELLDNQTKFERYHLLNRTYGKIYNFTTNIKPAPNPFYLLDKFCGNMTIHEYRSTFNTDRLFLILDKPLTRILPELHEDNSACLLNSRLIASSGSTASNKSDIINMFANIR